jgi:HK97 family phage major capsid protein
MTEPELMKLRAELESKFQKMDNDLQGFIKTANEEVKSAGSMSNETKAAVEALSKNLTAIVDRLSELEQKGAGARSDEQQIITLGDQLIKSPQFQACVKDNGGRASIQVKGSLLGQLETRTAIINATGQNQPLVPAMRVPGIITPANRRMTIRDLLPVSPTGSNLIEYAKENVFTNNAGPTTAGSPVQVENVTKPESGITFELASKPVVTLAHWIPVSKQVLSDAPMLASYINTRLSYGLMLKEEDQLLNGNGNTGNLSGLLDSGNFTVYNRGQTGDTKLDTLRRAITQAQLSEYEPDSIVLNPVDWEDIELIKTDDGAYVFSNPGSGTSPVRWNKPIVATNSISSGTFLMGAFSLAAQIWDREQASIAISFENSDNFVKNMATILAEERLALTVYRPAAFISGTF